MQKLVADHPELIADEDGALLLIQREQSISDREDGTGRWSLDHLFVTRAGVPVLVELKRAADTRLRREVVGQMFDYAANATMFWQAGRVAASFGAALAGSGKDPDAVLADFLGDSMEADEFWEQVDANFAAGRVKLVFVADTIPRELARIVEFLNEQMKAEVRAVELSWFEGEGGSTALTPRVIGRSERAQNEKALRSALPVSRDTWIAERLAPYGPELVKAAECFIDLVEEIGGRAEVTLAQGSMVAVFDAPNRPVYVARLTFERKGLVQLYLASLVYRPAFYAQEARQRIYDELVTIVGPLTTAALKGFPGFDARKLNDQSIRSAFASYLQRVLKLAISES